MPSTLSDAFSCWSSSYMAISSIVESISSTGVPARWIRTVTGTQQFPSLWSNGHSLSRTHCSDPLRLIIKPLRQTSFNDGRRRFVGSWNYLYFIMHAWRRRKALADLSWCICKLSFFCTS